MRQFWEIKEKNSDAIILFRMGDFYETFEEDAIITSKVLGITLTKRANGSAASVHWRDFNITLWNNTFINYLEKVSELQLLSK